MSYCRIGGKSDVYIFENMESEFVCDWCALKNVDEYERFTCSTRPEMLQHIKEHIENGDRVPGYAVERLEKEISQGVK